MGEAPLELRVRSAQRGLRVDLEVPRQRLTAEQKIADSPGAPLGLARRDLGLDLVDLLAQIGDHAPASFQSKPTLPAFS